MLERQLQLIHQKLDALLQAQPDQSSKKYYSLAEAAAYLCLSKSTLYKHTSSGEIAFSKPNGKLILFQKQDLDCWIQQHRIPANDEL